MHGQAAQGLAHLNRQLARRHQHQAVHSARCAARLAQQQLQHRQGVGGGFARAGLGAGLHIHPLQHGRNGQRLDGRGRRIVFGLEGLEEFWAQAKGAEGHKV